MPELFLALDVGTTSARAMLVAPDGTVAGLARRGIATDRPGPGRVEQDAEAIWQALLVAIREALGTRSMSDVAAIGVTTQRAGIMVWDAASSAPLTPLVVWSDTSGLARAAELAAAGFVAWGQFPSAKLAALRDRAPASRDMLCGPLDTWLVHRLSSGAHVIDLGAAWLTGFLDFGQPDRWNAELLAFLDLPAAMLPRIVDSWGPIAATTPGLFGRAIPITAMLADQQAGMVAHAALATGGWKATYGTSAVLMAALGGARGSATMPPEALVRISGVPHFATEGMVISAGSFVEWLCNGLGLYRDPAAFAAAARDALKDHQVTIVPALHGLGAPHGRLDARASMTGLSPRTTPAEIADAAMFGIAARVREIADAIAAIPDMPRHEALPVDGGLARDDGFLQRQADVLRIPVRRHAVAEATAYGAAVSAGIGAGRINETDLVDFARYDRTFDPVASDDEAQAAFSVWETARKRLF